MMKCRKILGLLILTGAFLFAPFANAQLSIEIFGAGANRIPVMVPAFAGEPLMAGSVSEVVRKDLERSGAFRLVDASSILVAEGVSPDWANLRVGGAEAILTGSMRSGGNGLIEVRFQFRDILRQSELLLMSMSVRPDQYRAVAHRIADLIYEKLLGQPGIFSTRIAYVVKSGTRYQLQIADADGENPQTALHSEEPIISPAWSPDAKQIAYVSFEKKKPIVYVGTLATGARTILSNYKGSNSAPAWSPDGKRLALTLTKDGSSQIYVVNNDGTGLRRLTNSTGIDTEAHFSPDGSHVYFTSDRGGSPQIYRVPVEGGAAQRVTFSGSYNVSPRVSPDGKTLSFITRNDGRFQVAIQDLASQQVQVLTDSAKDESPSFAPDGRTILYATEVGGRGVLSVVSTDARTRYRLNISGSDVREPVWAPFAR